MLESESRYSSALDQKPSRDPWLTMDYYLGTDSISLQEMLDIDIKGEIEGVIGGNPDLGINFSDLSPLDHDEDHLGGHNDFSGWFGSTSLLNGNSNSSNSNFNLDLSGSDAGSLMVNPNSVMPHTPSRGPISSRKTLLLPIKSEIKPELVEVKTDLETGDDSQSDGEDAYDENEASSESEGEETEDEHKHEAQEIVRLSSKTRTSLFLPANTIKISNGIQQENGQITKINGITGIRLQDNGIKIVRNTDQTNHQIYSIQSAGSALQNHGQNVNNSPSTKREYRDTIDPLANSYPDRSFPKPAYSYSCLIAMALKNSQTGSLPVSEIYNFMCEHFPYFKTAPNGWKNSVRHNLSLNKCFEKIEKPAGNSNQRKGCLWAINPSKVSKMDEEVQKWSRKDPLAIKKAMIYPDLLELLERGDMKYVVNGDASEETESSGDEATDDINDYHDQTNGHNANHSVTDSFDESSQDGDVDISDQLYDVIDIEDNKDALHMQLDITKEDDLDYDDLNDSNSSPVSKRPKITGNSLNSALHRNYAAFQQAAAQINRRKPPVYLATGPNSGSFVKIE